MPEAVIVATARSPIGRAFKGSLTSIRPDDLTAQIITAALDKVPQLNPDDIDDLLLGCGLPGGEQGFNMARVVAVLLGHDKLPGTTVTRYCSSSLQTTRMAFHAIKAGEADVLISAGVECVSRFGNGSSDSWPNTHNAAFTAAETRTQQSAEGDAGTWHDPREDGNIPDVYIAMGQTAENVAALRGITRAEQDEFGVRSQNLAEKAIADGFWQREIIPVTLPDGSTVAKDDGPRAGTTLEKVSQLKPVFRPDGRVTAGNSSGINDGAAGCLIAAEEVAAELGLTARMRLVDYQFAGVEPEFMGFGPVPATEKLLARQGLTMDDIGLIEINEAFAVQVLAFLDHFKIADDDPRVNPWGGAIAIGHPLASSGVRLMIQLAAELAERPEVRYGLTTMCIGMGMGASVLWENTAWENTNFGGTK
jgi:acetyl-CoA C-acetyltransferase